MLVRFAKKKVLWTELDYERMNWCSTHHDSEVVGQGKGLGKVHE